MKPFAIIASVIIVVVCLAYALSVPWQGTAQTLTDEPRSVSLDGVNSVVVNSEISSVRVTTTDASELTVRLRGTLTGVGGPAVLDVTNEGGQVRVWAHRQRGLNLFGFGSLELDVSLPQNYAGALDLSASAGSVSVDSELRVQSLKAHSSAGSVSVGDVIAEERIEIDSSAGSVNVGKLVGATVDLHSSAGSVSVDSCEAGQILLRSSAGSINANDLSGAVDANSSASSITLHMRDVKADVKADSSAGGVRVSIPADASADVDLSTSAGGVTANGLTMNVSEQKRDLLRGKLNGGGPAITLHSSAGSVELSAD